jgi:hypothetical protein
VSFLFLLFAGLILVVSGGLRYCGIGHGYDDVYVKGSAAEQKVSPIGINIDF